MKTLTASSCTVGFALLFAAGCADVDPGSEATPESFALLECGNPHHVDSHHLGHHHGRHHHFGGHGNGGSPGGGGSPGTGGRMGAGGTTGAGGTMGGGGGGGPAIDCTPPAGMISWWHADGDYDDAVGSNDGASAGAVSFGAGEQLSAFSLNGTANSYVEVPDAANLQVTGAFTIDAWINFAGGDGRIVDKVTAFSTDGYLLDMLGNNLRIFMGGDALSTPTPVPLGTFTHVAGVYDGTNLTLYVNGAMAVTRGTSVTATPTSTRSFRIGADSTGGTLFNGLIDEPRIFGRALSAAEILDIYQKGSVCP